MASPLEAYCVREREREAANQVYLSMRCPSSAGDKQTVLAKKWNEFSLSYKQYIVRLSVAYACLLIRAIRASCGLALYPMHEK